MKLIVRFIRCKGFISDGITDVTFSRISHTEAMTESGTWIGAHASGGVAERAANYCDADIVYERRYAIEVTEDEYAVSMAWLHAQIGRKYNVKDIIGIFFHHNMSKNETYICSQLMFDYLLQCGIRALNVLPEFANLVTPETLHLSPIWIGKLVKSIG